MAEIFLKAEIVDEVGAAVTDPAVASQARCLIVLDCCARFLVNFRPLATQKDLQAMNHLIMSLVDNIIDVAEADEKRMRRDVDAMAAALGITLHTVAHHGPAGSSEMVN